jgi:hypothetical protein
MDAGQVKSGQNPEDTFNKMLQHVARVTPQIADSITGTYKSVHSLMAAFERGGPDILEDFPVPNLPHPNSFPCDSYLRVRHFCGGES